MACLQPRLCASEVVEGRKALVDCWNYERSLSLVVDLTVKTHTIYITKMH